MNNNQRAIVLPDLHIPSHDVKSMALVYQLLEVTRPNKIVQVGDLVDFYPISKYTKDPLRGTGLELQRELDVAKTILETLSSFAPVVMLEGNHEVRLKKYLRDKAPSLCGLDVLSLPRLLGIDNKNTFLRENIYLGKLLVLHGDEVTSGGGASGKTATSTMTRLNQSVMVGHCHKLGAVFRATKGGGVQKGYEIGCLCDMAVDYVKYPDWQQGLAYVQYQDNGNKDFSVELIEIEHTRKGKGRRAFFRGDVYEI